MRRHIRCGQLFTGLGDGAERDQTVVTEGERIAYVGPERRRARGGAGRRGGGPLRPLRAAGPDRRPRPPLLRQRQDRGGHRPLRAGRVSRAARAGGGAAGACRRLHLDGGPHHQRPGDAVDPRRHRRGPFRRPPHQLLRAPDHQPPGALGLVSHLDRRARDLHRRARPATPTRASPRSAPWPRTAWTSSRSPWTAIR